MILCQFQAYVTLGESTRGNRYRHSSSAHSFFCCISLVSDAFHSFTPFPCSCKLSSALFPEMESPHLTMHLVGLAYLFMHNLGMWFGQNLYLSSTNPASRWLNLAASVQLVQFRRTSPNSMGPPCCLIPRSACIIFLLLLLTVQMVATLAV